MRKKRYPTVILLTSLQYANHLREYFVENSRKTIAYYILPRKGGTSNFFEIYQNGKKIKSSQLYSPGNIALWHAMLYINYLRILFEFTSRDEKIYFVNYLFTLFFLRTLVSLFRNITYVFWIGDYWPPINTFLKIYSWFLQFYHDRTKYVFYQTDRINKKMNGFIMKTFNKKTIIPGVNPPSIFLRNIKRESITLCFIGVLVPWQGIELLLKVVASNPKIKLKLIGTGNEEVVKEHRRLIKKYHIEDRVYFPNKFLYGDDLKKEVANSDIGIALYEVDPMKVTHYGDPAKIKQYMEYGLPIIMTNAAEVAKYIKKFNAGIIVQRNFISVENAIEKMKRNYNYYVRNLDSLNHWLNFRTFYVDAYKFMEEKL